MLWEELITSDLYLSVEREDIASHRPLNSCAQKLEIKLSKAVGYGAERVKTQ